MRCAGGGEGDGVIATGVGLGLGVVEWDEGEAEAACGPPQATNAPPQAITMTAAIAACAGDRRVLLVELTRHGP